MSGRNWWDVMRGATSGGDDNSALMEATVAFDVEDRFDQVTVTVDSFDGELEWGPMPWVRQHGDIALPQYGDRALIALARTEDEGEPSMWMIAYWSS